jgi:hypothetical protein
MPNWYSKLNDWLLSYGWGGLTIASFVVIGVTLWLWYQGKAVPLAAWLTYMFMP